MHIKQACKLSTKEEIYHSMIYYNVVEASTLTVTTQKRMNPRSTAHQAGMQTVPPQMRYTTRMIYYTVVEASTLTVRT